MNIRVLGFDHQISFACTLVLISVIKYFERNIENCKIGNSSLSEEKKLNNTCKYMIEKTQAAYSCKPSCETILIARRKTSIKQN